MKNIQELQRNFEIKLNELSVRAINILASLRLLNFEDFYGFFFIQQKEIDFQKARNCGVATEKQLSNFVESFIKESKLEKTCIASSLNSKQQSTLELTTKFRVVFQQQFFLLSTRTKNILTSINAHNPEVFLKKICFANSLKHVLQIENCGLKTFEEIQNFRKSILILVDKKEYFHSLGLFNDLEYYLFTQNLLKPEDAYILKHYFGFINSTEVVKLDEIAKKFRLTKERVRQISFAVLEKIKNISFNIYSKGNYDLDRYFPSDNFYCSEQLVSRINELEETNFNSSFITFVLEAIQPSDYKFIVINKKIKFYSGIFIKMITDFDFQACFEFLSQYVDISRKDNIEIKIADLIKTFGRTTKNTTSIKMSETSCITPIEVSKIINLFAEKVSNSENEILVTSDSIVFKRNKRKLKHEALEEILNEYKKPMHFTELYEECLKRNIKVASALSVHGMIQHYPEVFGLKGPGIYGLRKWGGYFGTIGDVAEELLKEKNKPMDKRELIQILSRELYISQDSISTVLFNYELENRFVKMKNSTVGLKEWLR